MSLSGSMGFYCSYFYMVHILYFTSLSHVEFIWVNAGKMKSLTLLFFFFFANIKLGLVTFKFSILLY